MSEARIYVAITILGSVLGSAVLIGLRLIGADPVLIFVALVLIGGGMAWRAGVESLRHSPEYRRR
jgi:hypothetical protein